MYKLKRLQRLRRLHRLIVRKATGTPEQLARRLQVSPATVYRDLEWLKAFDAPIIYCRDRQTYFYSERYELALA